MNEELKMIFYNIFSLYILFLVITFFVKKEDTEDGFASVVYAGISFVLFLVSALISFIFEGNAGPLKTLNDRPIIDTRSMSDPIKEMYTEFNSL